jgi:hypothetical protein
MESRKVDATGIPPSCLLYELWKASKPAAFFGRDPEVARVITQGMFKQDELDAAANGKNGVDYLFGRVIKAGPFIPDADGKLLLSPWGYDRDNGEGAFARVVAKIRFSGCGSHNN